MFKSPHAEGEAAAKVWIAADDFDRPEPRNPYDSLTDAARSWSAGYNAAIYAQFGDPDRDMERAERAFGC